MNFLISLGILPEAAASSEISLSLHHSISSTPYWILSRALTCKPNQLPKCIRLPYPIADDFTYPEEFQLHRKQT